jgi:agmatinase
MALRLAGLAPGSLALVGIPFDENSSFLRGPALAPARIREALFSGSTNAFAEDGTQVLGGPLVDVGDLTLPGGAAAIEAIERETAGIFERGARALSLGGDHSVSFPLVRAHARHHPGLEILHFDAHPDLYDQLDGNRLSHASPFARIMESGLARRLVQVGIRTLNPHQREQARRFGVEIVEMRHFSPELRLEFAGPVYVTIDLDALDPAFAPGVSHHEPGGLSVRDVLRVLERSSGRVVGADVVELNPLRDVAGVTAAVAAKLIKELAARMRRDERSTSSS